MGNIIEFKRMPDPQNNGPDNSTPTGGPRFTTDAIASVLEKFGGERKGPTAALFVLVKLNKLAGYFPNRDNIQRAIDTIREQDEMALHAICETASESSISFRPDYYCAVLVRLGLKELP